MAFPFFHGLLDVTFRFFVDNYGRQGLEEYLRWLVENYYADVLADLRRGGAQALAAYLADVVEDECSAQPDAEMEIVREADGVTLKVSRCPAFVWMEANGRQACEDYCEQCAVMGAMMAAAAGLEFELEGGQGACSQHFREAER